MSEYEDKFPLGLDGEEKAALEWKIEQDYKEANQGAISFKNEYVTFAINFYTRSSDSLKDIVANYRLHAHSKQRQNMADAFLTDMKTKLRERELAYN